MHNKTVIIGGGFYGLSVALYLYDTLGVKNIDILEKEKQTMTRASYVNQARVHNGYHYPRSILTGYRSAVNFPRFTKQFGAAIHSDFNKYYAVAKHLSKVNAHQFKNFADKIEADIAVAPPNIQKMFNKKLQIISDYKNSFDSASLGNESLGILAE